MKLPLQVLDAFPQHYSCPVQLPDVENQQDEGGDDDAGRGDVVQHRVQAAQRCTIYYLLIRF